MAQLLPPRRGEALTIDGIGSLRFLEYLESSTSIINTTVTITEEVQTTIEDNTKEGQARQGLRRDFSVQSSDYTTLGSEVVICTDKMEITLNATPDDQELVIIHAANGVVLIEGNGNTINNETSAVIRRNFTTWDLLYGVEIGGWIII